ncbi:TPA: hypothetical protein DEP58_02740 [Patescibacteria group bacterium]|nr:MAG: hypothetical protein UU98_C0027G0025 [Parcubacteria group bacterium GW2011_GWD2_42_14]HCC05200.1 hypothetical protein [Patescibacteria group bacterium]
MPNYAEHYGLSVVVIGLLCLTVAISLFINDETGLGIGFTIVALFSFYCSFVFRDKAESKKEKNEEYTP